MSDNGVLYMNSLITFCSLLFIFFLLLTHINKKLEDFERRLNKLEELNEEAKE